jgi:1,4-dihydroxy-2-naphthoate octaprenyltransferase
MSWAAFALAFVGACALHIAANTWNDAFDWASGTDQANNDYFLPFSGGSRSIELGLISERGLRLVAWSSVLVAAACGAVLAFTSTPWVLAFGAVGALGGYFYTAPPLRLVARHGLGELLIALCFGPFMTAGTFAAVTGAFLTNGALDAGLENGALAGIPVGLLCAAILFINEFPDAESDAKTGKNHLVVTLGKPAARIAFAALLSAAFASVAILVVAGVLAWPALAAFLALPLAVRALVVLFKHTEDRELVTANKSTIQLHAIAGLLFAAAIAFGTIP